MQLIRHRVSVYFHLISSSKNWPDSQGNFFRPSIRSAVSLIISSYRCPESILKFFSQILFATTQFPEHALDLITWFANWDSKGNYINLIIYIILSLQLKIFGAHFFCIGFQLIYFLLLTLVFSFLKISFLGEQSNLFFVSARYLIEFRLHLIVGPFELEVLFLVVTHVNLPFL